MRGDSGMFLKMSALILIRIGSRYYSVLQNPRYISVRTPAALADYFVHYFIYQPALGFTLELIHKRFHNSTFIF